MKRPVLAFKTGRVGLHEQSEAMGADGVEWLGEELASEPRRGCPLGVSDFRGRA